jgi:hypothetical protein
MSRGVQLIAAERFRHEEVEGWTPGHDAAHDGEEMALAAMCYACPPTLELRPVVDADGSPVPPGQWPWSDDWWKPSPEDRVRELVKAGSLCAAEIDRLLPESESPLDDIEDGMVVLTTMRGPAFVALDRVESVVPRIEVTLNPDPLKAGGSLVTMFSGDKVECLETPEEVRAKLRAAW